MKASVVCANEDIRYQDYPTPEIKSGHIMVKVVAAGICGSDIPRVLKNGVHFYPIVLGHEFSGEVIEVADDVDEFAIGDRVAGVPLVPCMKCADCQEGRYSLCKYYTFIGSRIQGAFADYVLLPRQNAVKFDNNVSYEQGALFEPSSVALHGLLQNNFHGGTDVAILGCGTIGLFTAQWARILGAKRVFVFDIDKMRLNIMKSFKVDHLINTGDANFMEEVRQLTNGRGFDFVFETAGIDTTMQLAFEIAANKAHICYIGTATRDITFNYKQFELMNRKEFHLTGSWMSYSAPFPGKEWSLTAHYFSTGELIYDESIIFKKYPMRHAQEAFMMYKTPGLVKGKIMLMN